MLSSLPRDLEDGNRKDALAQLARDPRISESCLRNWFGQDGVESGDKPGMTKAELRELVPLRRELDRDLLSRAAAFFAPENGLPKRQ